MSSDQDLANCRTHSHVDIVEKNHDFKSSRLGYNSSPIPFQRLELQGQDHKIFVRFYQCECSPSADCICSLALWDSLGPTFDQCNTLDTPLISWSDFKTNFTHWIFTHLYIESKKIYGKDVIKLKLYKINAYGNLALPCLWGDISIYPLLIDRHVYEWATQAQQHCTRT